MNSIFSAFFWGSLFGLLNGFISRYALKKSINKKDKIFYSVFLGGILYRLLFLIISVLFLKDKKAIILLVYCVSLIFFQFIFEVKPIKVSENRAGNGTQRNS